MEKREKEEQTRPRGKCHVPGESGDSRAWTGPGEKRGRLLENLCLAERSGVIESVGGEARVRHVYGPDRRDSLPLRLIAR